MSAATSAQQTPLIDSYPASAPNEAKVQLASTTLWENSLAMQVAGKAQPDVAGTAGSTLLGVPIKTYTNPAGTDRTYPDDEPMVFRRGVISVAGKAGDLPTEALIGKVGLVAFEDSSGIVKATVAANDCVGTLRRIRNGLYGVEI